MKLSNSDGENMKTLFKIIIFTAISLFIFGCKDEERKSQISFTFDSAFILLNKQLDSYLDHRKRPDNSRFDVIVVYGEGANTGEKITLELTDSTDTFINGYTGVMTTNAEYCQTTRCFDEVYQNFNCTVNSFGGEGGYIEGRFDGYLSAITPSSSETGGTSSEGTVKALLQEGVFYLRVSAERTSY